MNAAPIILAYLLPIGIILIAWGSWDNDRARDNAATALWVMSLAAIIYAAIGFGFQFGGVGLRSDVPPGLHGLDHLWSPVVGANARNWSLLGFEGFMLNAQSTLPDDTALLFSLFLHQLPMVLAASLVPALALAGRARLFPITIITFVTAGFIIPIVGAWTWGGGWLYMLGADAKFGHGFIDPGGAASALTIAGFTTLAALSALKVRRAPQQPIELPRIVAPLRSAFGAIVFGFGWLTWLTSDPILQANRSIDLAFAATNTVLGAASATIVSAIFGWFTSGKPNAQLAARGVVSGSIALMACAPFIPPGSAIMVGVIAGLWTPIGLLVIERWLHLDDSSGSIASIGFAGLWSIVAVGLLADGTYGAGWNNLGVRDYLGVSGQGITGLFAAPNLQNDPGQMSAQITGALTIVLVTLAITWLIARPLRRWRILRSESSDRGSGVEAAAGRKNDQKMEHENLIV